MRAAGQTGANYSSVRPQLSARRARRAARPLTMAQAEKSKVAAPKTSEAGGGFEEGGAMWGGRFEEKTSPVVEKYGQSVSYDKRLWPQDLKGSRAHAAMLAAQGLISAADLKAILTGMEAVEADIKSDKFQWLAEREDVHMNIEASLIARVGDAAKRLHTARSRNDQVVTDVRLYVRDSIDMLRGKMRDTQVAIYDLAAKNEGLVLPGYTHMQRAQPVLAQHWLLAYVEQLERDRSRMTDVRSRVNICPLGACALAGTGLNIDRFATAKSLGFSAPMANSIDAVATRDFLIEFVSDLAICAINLSRLAEDWVLWSTEEFGFITPSDAVSTGSSIMPQKKNPDPMELLRGKSARVVGATMTLMTLVKGLPHAYNRDLQEDKEPLFDAVETIAASLEVTAEFARNVKFNKSRIYANIGRGYLDATTLADYLVRKGVPFRSGHEIVGKCVALALAKDCELGQLPLDVLQKVDPVFAEDVYKSLGFENAIANFQSYGSTGVKQVAEQMALWKAKIAAGPL